MDDFIRREARRFVKTLKTRRLNGAGVKLSASEKKKIWPYSDDEIEIAHDTSWDRVQAVLDLVGNADQFERIRDEALRLYGMPENVLNSHPLHDHDEAIEEMRKALAEHKARTHRGYDHSKLADFK
jgi:hypothetical protein